MSPSSSFYKLVSRKTSLSFFVTLSPRLWGAISTLSLIALPWGNLSAKAAFCHLMPHLFLVQSSVGDFDLVESLILQRTLYHMLIYLARRSSRVSCLRVLPKVLVCFCMAVAMALHWAGGEDKVMNKIERRGYLTLSKKDAETAFVDK